MEPMTLSLLGGGVGLLGGLFGLGGDGGASEYIQKAAGLFDGIVPPDLAQAIAYQMYEQGGALTPQQLSALPIEAQEVIKLQEKPEMRQRQEAQLSALESLARTGMGPQEKLAMEEARLRAAQEAQARNQGLLQKFQQMGQGGASSTQALMAQLQAGQDTAQNEMLANMKAAAMAAENRRAAIQQAMAGAEAMRGRDLTVEQYNIDAARERQKFDIQNAIARQQFNARSAQEANLENLRRQQSIMDKNIGQSNQEIYRRQYLAPQQMYQNQMELARQRAGIYGQQANLAQNQAQARAQGWGNIFGGIGNLASGYGKAMQDQRMTDLIGNVHGFKWNTDTNSWEDN